MSLHVLSPDLIFPPLEQADADGLLAIGGDLSVDRLLLAYRSGIFPWYENRYILWWCPDPRFVLFPAELRVSKSMKQLFRKNVFECTVNKQFRGVIGNCKTISRNGQDGTWITEEMQAAYIRLHELGFAHSIEAWQNGELVGGLYGIRLGKVFFGESMFSKVSNASKYAFIFYTGLLASEGVEIIDCQLYTQHLESLGARMIPRDFFMEKIHSALC